MAVQVIKRQEMAPKVPTVGTRTVCYVRVSSLSDEQAGSYASQSIHFETMIKTDPELVYAGTYGDEGVTGTSLEHREGFKQMMRDAEDHKFDQIYTKSISRFGRNVLDSLVSLRRLKELGISVRFFKEGISTMDSSGELLLLVLSSLSQAESQSISENVKMGIRYRFQEGRHFINCSRFLGYDKVDGQLVINPTEAATVRRIFSLFLNGHSVDMIARTLTEEAVPTGAGKTKWYPTTVRYLLSNEKYVGDLRLQKTVVPNFLTHRSKKNTGEADQFYVENSHDPIIPRDVFDMAQVEAARRAASRLDAAGKRTGGIRYGSKKALSGRCKCGCGAVLLRKRSNPGRWVCPQCGYSISESQLQSAVMDSFRKLQLEKDNLRILLAATEEQLSDSYTDGKGHQEGCGGHLQAGWMGHLQTGWKGTGGTAESCESSGKEIEIIKGKENDMTEEERAEALFRRFQILATLDWLENQGKSSLGEGSTCYTMEQFIDVTRPGRLDAWNDDLILKFVEGMELTDDGEVAVRFKAGVTVTVEIPERRLR